MAWHEQDSALQQMQEYNALDIYDEAHPAACISADEQYMAAITPINGWLR